MVFQGHSKYNLHDISYMDDAECRSYEEAAVTFLKAWLSTPVLRLQEVSVYFRHKDVYDKLIEDIEQMAVVDVQTLMLGHNELRIRREPARGVLALRDIYVKK